MATPALNNGIFLRQTEVKTSSNIDKYHLRNMIGGTEPTDMGPVDLWAMAQQVRMPLYQFSNFNGKNVIMVDDIDGRYSWKLPIVEDQPYMMGDMDPTNTKKGIDGQTFQIKINKRAFGHNAVISYDKYNGVELYVTDADIINVGDGWVYTVQLVNNDSYKFLSNQYLKEGTRLFQITTAKSDEYGERYSDMGEISNGYREFYNYIGNYEANIEYHISTQADHMLRNGITAKGTMPLVELWRNKDKNIDPSVNSLETLVTVMGKDYAQKAMANGTLQRSFLTRMEAAHMNRIATDIETYLMWGKGGIINGDGPDKVRLAKGLWAQTDNGYKRIYNRGTFSLDMFQSEIYNYYAGKVDFKGPDSGRELVVQTGIAGMRLVSEAIQRKAMSTGGVINMDQSGVGAIKGEAMDLSYGFAFTRFQIPFLANVKFVVNPAFDQFTNENSIENPMIDGYPLSSYNFIVFDVTEQGNDNIFLLKNAFDHNMHWHYQNGTMDYMGRTSGFLSVGNFSGYKVKMAQRAPAIWIKDPTRVMKIVMRNPISGATL